MTEPADTAFLGHAASARVTSEDSFIPLGDTCQCASPEAARRPQRPANQDAAISCIWW